MLWVQSKLHFNDQIRRHEVLNLGTKLLLVVLKLASLSVIYEEVLYSFFGETAVQPEVQSMHALRHKVLLHEEIRR